MYFWNESNRLGERFCENLCDHRFKHNILTGIYSIVCWVFIIRFHPIFLQSIMITFLVGGFEVRVWIWSGIHLPTFNNSPPTIFGDGDETYDSATLESLTRPPTPGSPTSDYPPDSPKPFLVLRYLVFNKTQTTDTGWETTHFKSCYEKFLHVRTFDFFWGKKFQTQIAPRNYFTWVSIPCFGQAFPSLL